MDITTPILAAASVVFGPALAAVTLGIVGRL
jgi:hypothetical protein